MKIKLTQLIQVMLVNKIFNIFVLNYKAFNVLQKVENMLYNLPIIPTSKDKI
jgi:hypothetical protein